MSLSNRAFPIFTKISAAVALVAASFQPAGTQALRGPGSRALVDGQGITFIAPQFKVEALWFKANDETGWYWTGSDEVYAVFSDMDPTHFDGATAVYGNVDEGDTVNFSSGDRCMAPQPNCDRGMADLNVRFSFWEHDPRFEIGYAFCPGDIAGGHTRLEEGLCSSHDLIGRGSVIYSRDELVAMLPAVGDTREFTAVMDKDAGKYRFRYRITRLADIERSIVIHLPPDFGLPPAITLESAVDAIRKTVTLTWSGATTASVDLSRNGSNIVTTPNDGTHVDTVVAGTYQYRLCNQGSTSVCSAQIQVVMP